MEKTGKNAKFWVFGLVGFVVLNLVLSVKTTFHGYFASASDCRARMRALSGAIEMYNTDEKVPISGSSGTMAIDLAFQEKLIGAGYLKSTLYCPGGLFPFPPPQNTWMTISRIIPSNCRHSLFPELYPAFHRFCYRKAGCYSKAPGATFTAIISADGNMGISCPDHGPNL